MPYSGNWGQIPIYGAAGKWGNNWSLTPIFRMETMGQRGLPRTQKARGQRARGLEHKQERAWPMAAEQNASVESGTACKNVSSNGATRVGTGQGSMRATKFQGTAGYVTRMSGGVGGRGREASSYPDRALRYGK